MVVCVAECVAVCVAGCVSAARPGSHGCKFVMGCGAPESESQCVAVCVAEFVAVCLAVARL